MSYHTKVLHLEEMKNQIKHDIDEYFLDQLATNKVERMSMDVTMCLHHCPDKLTVTSFYRKKFISGYRLYFTTNHWSIPQLISGNMPLLQLAELYETHIDNVEKAQGTTN